MSTLTPAQLEALKRSGQITDYSTENETVITADKFIGDLEGNADTATRFKNPSHLSVSGDASGHVDIYGNDSNTLEITVNHASNADNASNAANASRAVSARKSDLANIATLAYNSLLSQRSLTSDEATHAETADNADVATKDSAGNNIASKFTDHQTQITANTNKNVTQDSRLTSLETLTSNHTGEITSIKAKNVTQDSRLTELEDFTDVKNWDDTIPYKKDKIVLYQFNFYQSKVNNNLNHNPSETDSAYWKLLSETAGSGTQDCVHLDGEENVIGLKHFNGGATAVTLSAGHYSTHIATTEYADRAVNTLNNAVQQALNLVVTLSSAQYITGLKTFNTLPQSSVTPSDNKDMTTKIYVDEAIENADDKFVTLSSAQYITGRKNFLNGSETVMPEDASNTELTNKGYVDDNILSAINDLKKYIHLPTYQREYNFEADKLTISVPSKLSIKVNDKYYYSETASSIDISSEASWDDSTLAVASNRAGKDFYIYAVEHEDTTECKLILSANSTVPTGYTADTSRKIGGFHCLCNSVEAGKVWYDFVTKTDIAHPLAGYVTGDILPCSIWDLLHRSNSENEGMVFDPDTRLWWDIYLESWDGYNAVSSYGGTHITGTSSYPAHGEKFAELASLVHKRLPDRDDFICVAKGSPENTNIAGSNDVTVVGGHVDTSSRRMISKIGLEECCGYLWQWVRTSNANGSSNWQSTTYASAVDGAKSYGSSYGAFYRALVGGNWSDGSYCGSRCVSVDPASAYVSGIVGARFCAKERIINFI